MLCHHEIFNPGGIHVALRYRGALDLGSVEERDRDPGAVLRRVWENDFGCRAVGLKMTRETRPAAFGALFAERGTKAIVLSRRNRVKTFVSERIAAATGLWESYRGESHPGATSSVTQGAKPTQIAVDRDELLAHVERNERFYAWLRRMIEASGWESLDTAYEELPSTEERRRILTFLGVDPDQALHGSTRKQGTHDLARQISNFDLLAGALSGSELEAELHERDY